MHIAGPPLCHIAADRGIREATRFRNLRSCKRHRVQSTIIQRNSENLRNTKERKRGSRTEKEQPNPFSGEENPARQARRTSAGENNPAKQIRRKIPPAKNTPANKKGRKKKAENTVYGLNLEFF